MKTVIKYYLLTLALYGALMLLSSVLPEGNILAYVVLVPYFAVYIFHQIGIPGLLENNGLCGWGWCSPTDWGWTFLVCFWLTFTWIAIWGSVRIFKTKGL